MNTLPRDDWNGQAKSLAPSQNIVQSSKESAENRDQGQRVHYVLEEDEIMKNRFSLPTMVAVGLLLAPVNVQAQAPVRIVEPLPVPVQTTIPAEAYQRSVNTAVWTEANNGATSTAGFFNIWGIPAGKALVVEHVSVRVRVNPGEKVSVSIACLGTPAGVSNHHLTLTSQGTFDGFEHLVGSTPLRCYTTNQLIVSFVRNSIAPLTLTANTEFSVSGFLSDIP